MHLTSATLIFFFDGVFTHKNRRRPLQAENVACLYNKQIPACTCGQYAIEYLRLKHARIELALKSRRASALTSRPSKCMIEIAQIASESLPVKTVQRAVASNELHTLL